MADILSEYYLEFISKSEDLLDVNYLKKVFLSNTFDMLILTNISIPIAIIKQHISLLPDNRTYGVLLISGYFDEEVCDICKNDGIISVPAPFEPDVLRAVIAGLENRNGRYSSK